MRLDGSRSGFAVAAIPGCSVGRELENAPEDSVLTELFALRQGLCQMVDAGALSVDKATAIFERARSKAAVERRKEERDQLQDRGLRL